MGNTILTGKKVSILVGSEDVSMCKEMVSLSERCSNSRGVLRETFNSNITVDVPLYTHANDNITVEDAIH